MLILAAACAPAAPPATAPGPTANTARPTLLAEPTAPPSSTLPAAPSPSLESPSQHIVDFEGARSVSAIATAGGPAYVIVGRGDRLYVYRSTDGGQSFAEGALATLNAAAFVLPVERPAIAANAAGQVAVAWLRPSEDFSRTDVWYAQSQDGGVSFGAGVRVATDEGETAMVRVALDGAGNPALVWLNGSSLRIARSFDQGLTFAETGIIGAGACECCQPQPVFSGDSLYIAYRGLEPDPPAGTIRDIILIRSMDGGHTFGPFTRISDAHWYLEACPIAGPALALHAGDLYAAWMDGREAAPGSLFDGHIWFASSADGGQTFSANRRVSPEDGGHHTLPAMAIGPGGRIHLAWEAQGPAGDALLYTTSNDGGQTFAPPAVMADGSDPDRGRPGKPSLAVDDSGRVLLAWLDSLGAHLAVWSDIP